MITISEKDQIEYDHEYNINYDKNMAIEFERQLKFANRENNREYYDTKALMSIRATHIKGHKIHWIVGHVGGARVLDRMINIYKAFHGV